MRVVMMSRDDPFDLAQADFRLCHDGNSICGGYNSAMDSSGMGIQVGRCLAS